MYTGLLVDNPRGRARGTAGGPLGGGLLGGGLLGGGLLGGGPLGGALRGGGLLGGGPLGGALRGGGPLGSAVRDGAPFDSVGEDVSINEAVFAKRLNSENMSDKPGMGKRWMNGVME